MIPILYLSVLKKVSYLYIYSAYGAYLYVYVCDAYHYVSDRLDGYIRVCFYEKWARMVNPQVFLHQFDIKRVYSAY